MPEIQKDYLIREAKLQTRALQRIGVWRRAALSAAAVGTLLAYTGFVPEINILSGVFGIVITVLGGGVAFVIHTGYKKGKKNVENILKAVQR